MLIELKGRAPGGQLVELHLDPESVETAAPSPDGKYLVLTFKSGNCILLEEPSVHELKHLVNSALGQSSVDGTPDKGAADSQPGRTD